MAKVSIDVASYKSMWSAIVRQLEITYGDDAGETIELAYPSLPYPGCVCNSCGRVNDKDFNDYEGSLIACPRCGEPNPLG